MAEIKCPKCGEVFQVDETGYAEILKEVRNREFENEVNKRLTEIAEGSKKDMELALAKSENQKVAELTKKDLEIAELKNKVALADNEKKIAVSEAVAKMNKEIAEKERSIGEQQNQITLLKGNLDSTKAAAELRQKEISQDYEEKLRFKEEELAHYKEFKQKLSTKMIGESLERFCEDEFNKLRATGFRDAYFEKDNDSADGTKGDYIFRDYDESRNEYISIMFEMKNEMDDTEKKHKNETFFKKLDEDRTKKSCEYAVLVSTLEGDSEYYNQGIVDVSHKYAKMYVIRPQFFIPMITLLRNAAQGTIALQHELAVARSQSIDITHFEEKMNEFKDKFGTQYRFASQKFESAIADIDKSIKMLQKIKEELISSGDHLRLANERAEDLSIKKLTNGNPTMKQAFAALESSNE